MSINAKDVKLLWGLAAGRCSAPACPNKCVDYIKDDPVTLAEMAHIIPKSKTGPRQGEYEVEDNTYSNLILLCPYHHSQVDKLPLKYGRDLLLSWKAAHEERVRKALDIRQYCCIEDLFAYIQILLVENKEIWLNFGPDSKIAKENPNCDTAKYWHHKKFETVIPNNRKIINTIEKNIAFLDKHQIEVFTLFKVHAEAFEDGAFIVMENLPRFPIAFEEMIYE